MSFNPMSQAEQWMKSFSFISSICNHAHSYAEKARAHKVCYYYSSWQSDKTLKLLLFTPLCRSLNLAECFSADTSCLPGEKYDFLPVRLLLPGAAASLSHSGDIGTSRDLPPPAAVRFAKTHLKESDFHARRDYSFLTIITWLQWEDPMLCWEIHFSTGTLVKDFGRTDLRLMVSGSCENGLNSLRA